MPDKQFGQFIDIAPHLLKMLKTTNADFQSFVLFTDLLLIYNRPLEIEDNVDITLIIGIG